MTRRSRAREVALQLLFQRDHHSSPAPEFISTFANDRLREPALIRFCLALYEGVGQNLDDIDTKLAAAAENWRVSRMSTVDRNILRMGAFELLRMHETPPAVVLDEAIELARRYGSADSSAFVNGVLDRLRREAFPEVPTETKPAEAVP